MSYTGSVITRYVATARGAQAALAKRTGINTSILTRIQGGERDATLEVVTRLIDALDDDWASEIVLAWLKDQTPENGKRYVTVTRSKTTIAPAEPITDLASAFAILQGESEHNAEVQRLVLGLGKLVERLQVSRRYVHRELPAERVAEDDEPSAT